MGWALFPINADTRLDDPRLRELWLAVNERVGYRDINNIPPASLQFPPPEPGVDPPWGIGRGNQDGRISALQIWLEGSCSNFVRSHDDAGVLYPADHYDHIYWMPTPTVNWPWWTAFSFETWTTATFFAVAGIDPRGWIRKYPREIFGLTEAGEEGQKARNVWDGCVYVHTAGVWVMAANPTGESPDTLTGYGFARDGDYATNPEMWNQIYRAIRLLRWKYVAPGGGPPMAGNVTTSPEGGQRVVFTIGDSWANALANAQTEWLGNSFYNFGQLEAFSFGYNNPPGGGTWVAGYNRCGGPVDVSGPFFDYQRGVVDTYFRAEQPPHNGVCVYDDNGDGLAENVWTKIHTHAYPYCDYSAGTPPEMVPFGNIDTLPVNPNTPGTDGIQQCKGYKITGMARLFKISYTYD